MTFSQNLSELRQKREKSQRAAAKDLGISQSLLSHYENRVREPGLDFVLRACEYYGVSADYLLGRPASMPFAGGRLESVQNFLKDSLTEEQRGAVERYLTLAAYKMTAVLSTQTDAETLAAINAELARSELAVIRENAAIPPPPPEIRDDIAEIVNGE